MHTPKITCQMFYIMFKHKSMHSYHVERIYPTPNICVTAHMRNTYLQDYRLDYITVFYIRRQKEMDHNRICHYTNYSKKLQLKYFVIYVHICHRLFHPQPKNI